MFHKIDDNDVIVKALQAQQTSDLSQIILKPLLQKIYHCEIGLIKCHQQRTDDLIVHKNDELGDPAVICVLLTNINVAPKSAPPINEQLLVSQLARIRREGVDSDITDSKLAVQKVVLVTPFSLNRAEFDTQFKALNIAIRTHKVRLIDGVELSKLIIRHFPELLNHLVKSSILINRSVTQSFDHYLAASPFKFNDLASTNQTYCQLSVISGEKYRQESTSEGSTAATNFKPLAAYPLNLISNLPVNEQEYEMEDLFASGGNIVVLGHSGCGKTTILRQYAEKLLAKCPEKLTILTTLNNIAQCAESINDKCILAGLLRFLQKLNHPITLNQLSEHFTHLTSVVMLDSIDEAIVEHPWVIDAMVLFSSLFPKCQVITSSRYCVPRLGELPFLNLSMLPFNLRQQSQFILDWFKSKPSKAQALLEHLNLNPQLAKIVSNPLCATILCILCENDIPLPKSEAALHKKRIEMMAGIYDQYRGIKRTSLEPTFLIDVARVIAFGMHIRKRIRFEKSQALSVCLNFFNEPHQQPKIVRAIEELISPTEIIVPANDGGYDFGQLNIQAYLASEELINRRNISYKTLIHDQWWNDAFILMAQHAREIESVVNEICATNLVEKVKPLLMKMIASRSSHEQEVFSKRINQSHRCEFGSYY